VGGNFRLDALQAAVLRVKLPHLALWTEARRANAARYRQLFAALDPAGRVGLPHEVETGYHIYNQFVVRVPNRDRLREKLTAADIGTEIYYPLPFHRQPCFGDLASDRGAFPEADRAAAESLALPIYGELTSDQQQYVVEQIVAHLA
jgi:dTDP-4-amino-4,6-dideoxygalactose transaminase